MKKIGILFTARNNYELLDNWMKKVDTTGYEILSIDEDSTDENKSIGQTICNKHNVVYMDRDERGMQHNVKNKMLNIYYGFNMIVIQKQKTFLIN